MRKRFTIGTTIVFVLVAVCWFRLRQNQQGATKPEVVTSEVEKPPQKQSEVQLVTLDQISSEKLFEILAAPRPLPSFVVTNDYNGAPEVKPFIDNTIVEQANRCNAIFRFAVETNGQLKRLSLDDLNYSATTMLGTFKFDFVTKPDYKFAVVFSAGMFESFVDSRFSSDVFDRNTLKYEALRRATNYITKEEAVKLVENTLFKLGYTPEHLKPFGEPYIRHLAFTHDGKQHVLPYYFIDYRDPESDSEPKSALLSAEVLGIEPGGRITHFFDAYWKLPRIQIPEGYREKVEAYWRSQGKTPPRL